MSRSVTLRASLPSGQFSSESKLAEPTQQSKTLKTAEVFITCCYQSFWRHTVQSHRTTIFSTPLHFSSAPTSEGYPGETTEWPIPAVPRGGQITPGKESQRACSKPAGSLWGSFLPAENGWAELKAESWEQKSDQEANSGCRAGLPNSGPVVLSAPEGENLKMW